MKDRLSLSFIWHMHQPLYKDLITGEYHLPWVRLHSTFSYLDMIEVLDGFGDIRVNFNLTPSLLWQLEDISSAENISDRYLELSIKNAADLDERDKLFLLRNFFSSNLRGDAPFIKKYRGLLARRGENLEDDALSARSGEFSVSDWRDLQVYFNLAWCGFTLSEQNALCGELIRKAYCYSEEDKELLLALQLDVVRSIIPRYKRMADQGRVELTTTPYYHPILPLLLDPGKKALYDTDAAAHLAKAAEYHERLFGERPRGMWPAEGAVGQEVIPFFAREGIEWIASCESVLNESLAGEAIPDAVSRIYRVREGESELDMIFRHEGLSNAISFNYSGMPPERAVSEFMGSLCEHKRRLSGDVRSRMVSIIMDGENPWPYFPGGGGDFLRRLYGQISVSDEISTVCVSDKLNRCREREIIGRLHTGSWIARDLSKWSGSPGKFSAWDELDKAKRAAAAREVADERLQEEILIAESSDWFWWYDETGSHLDLVFDELFRMHLRNIYMLSGRPVPEYLHAPLAPPEDTRFSHPGRTSTGAMARPLSVLFVTSECAPFAKTGGLADVSAALPKALKMAGTDISVVMPLYPSVRSCGVPLKLEMRNVKGPGRLRGFDIYSTSVSGVKTYFIHKKRYFGRKELYGTSRGDYPDNAYRFSFFCKAVLELIRNTASPPRVIHCNDWQTALIPLYLRSLRDERLYGDVRTLYTIHNMEYQGIFPEKVLKGCGIPRERFNMHELEFYGDVNFMKSGILYSDAVSTVSPGYAREIMTPSGGAGLHDLVRSREGSVWGILNGVDYSVWSPENDDLIARNYSPDSLDGKADCKRDLIASCGLDISPEAPLLGSVGRLVMQKGADLLARVSGKLAEAGCALVVMGTGDESYERAFGRLMRRYPGRIFFCSSFDEALAHKVEAGSDIFLMPSRYEPCGLNQMYSIRYGTIPVVRRTGGLADVITDHHEDRDNSNGFVFEQMTESCFYGAISRALEVFRKRPEWESLMRRAMRMDFSWAGSAREYERLYRRIAGGDR